MKNISLVVVAVCACIVLSGSKAVESPDALKIFNKVAFRLANIKSVKYRFTKEFNYPSNDYLYKSEGDMYISFAKDNDRVGFRYFYQSNDGVIFFNNAELVSTDAQKKTMTVKRKVKLENFSGNPPLFHSIITLRNALPLIINDKSILKTVSDTTIKDKVYYLLQFNLQNRYINYYLGTEFSNTTTDVAFHYKIIADKSSYLPVTVLRTIKGSLDLNRTDFIDIDTNPAPPADSVWYYSSYQTDYRLEEKQKVNLIKPGTTAPDWQFTDLRSDTATSLAKYKGNVVLLEFWIKNCGYCIEAVPRLNRLQQAYGDKKLKILSINTEDSKKAIAQYITNHGVKFPVLYSDNQDVNKAYGIASYPQVVLIDTTGKVIYAGLIEIEKIEPLIRSNLASGN